MDNTKLYRKEGQSQVVDAQGNLQSYTGNLDSLPIYNQSTITASSLQPQPKIQLPEEQTPPVTPTSQPNLTTSYLDELKLNANEKEAQYYQTKGISQLIQDTLALEGEKTTLAEEQKRAGVGTLRQDLQNINSQILKKTAEVNQDDITLVANLRAEERRDTLLPFAEMGKAKLAGDAMIVRALKNAEIGVLNATAIAKQGDIALAKETAQEAVDVKYAPYKARIERYNTIVNALKPYLDAAEKKELAKQTFKGNTALKEIEKVSDYQKTILANAISGNAPQSVINAISKGQSVEEITKAGAGYLRSKADILDEQLKRMQISKIGADIAKDNAKKVVNAQGLRQLDDTEYSKFTANPNYKAVSDGTKYQRALSDFKKAVEKYGTGEIISAKGKGELGSAYSTLVATTKDYYTLGTLDAGVQKLVSLGVPEPTKLRIRDKRVLSAVDELSSQAQKSVDSAKNQLGKSVYGDTIEYQSLLDESGLNNQKITEEDYTDQILNSSASSPFNVFEQ